MVLHHCDTPACVNPDHLYLGGYAENAADVARRGRLRGERNGRALLNRTQVQTIRFLRAHLPVTTKYLAGLYGVTKSCMDGVLRGKNWRDDEVV